MHMRAGHSYMGLEGSGGGAPDVRDSGVEAGDAARSTAALAGAPEVRDSGTATGGDAVPRSAELFTGRVASVAPAVGLANEGVPRAAERGDDADALRRSASATVATSACCTTKRPSSRTATMTHDSHAPLGNLASTLQRPTERATREAALRNSPIAHAVSLALGLLARQRLSAKGAEARGHGQRPRSMALRACRVHVARAPPPRLSRFYRWAQID